MSFLKFRSQTNSGDQNLYWARADEDGAPFRGPAPPMIKDPEYEAAAQRVWDTHAAIFDIRKPKQVRHGRTLQEVRDGCANNWFRCIGYREKWSTNAKGKPTMLIFISWAEPYMELPQK